MRTIRNLVAPKVGVMKGHIILKTFSGCEMSDGGEVCNKLVMGL